VGTGADGATLRVLDVAEYQPRSTRIACFEGETARV